MLDRLTQAFGYDQLVFIDSRPPNGLEEERQKRARFRTHSLPRDLPSRFSKYVLYGAMALRAVRVARLLREERCDRILACSGSILDLPAGYLASKLAQVPFLAYLFDDYLYQWQDAFYRAFVRSVEPSLIGGARTVIVPNEFLEMDYRIRHKVKGSSKLVVIRNAHSYLESPPDGTPIRLELQRPAKIVFGGAVYHANSDAFRCLESALAELDCSTVTLSIYTTQSEGQLRQQGLLRSGTVVYPHVPPAEMFSIQQAADILYLPLGFNTPIPRVIRTSAPGKLGEYLASGRPILAHVPADSWVNWYFREHECGLVVNSTEADVLRDGIERLLSDHHLRESVVKNARRQAREEFALSTARGRFARAVMQAEGST